MGPGRRPRTLQQESAGHRRGRHHRVKQLQLQRPALNSVVRQQRERLVDALSPAAVPVDSDQSCEEVTSQLQLLRRLAEAQRVDGFLGRKERVLAAAVAIAIAVSG